MYARKLSRNASTEVWLLENFRRLRRKHKAEHFFSADYTDPVVTALGRVHDHVAQALLLERQLAHDLALGLAQLDRGSAAARARTRHLSPTQRRRSPPR